MVSGRLLNKGEKDSETRKTLALLIQSKCQSFCQSMSRKSDFTGLILQEFNL